MNQINMKQLFLILALALNITAFAQEDKTATLVVSGQGKTQDEAKQNALRSAVEQAFGVFISSNTEILNDNLVKDEIASISNGNIQKFELVSGVQLPDGGYSATIKATVSISKLTSFCESKGIDVEFKGGLFAINIKQQILNEVSETKAVWNLLFMLSPIAFQSIDYIIDAQDPQSSTGSNEKWEIPITVTALGNTNAHFLFDYLKKQLSTVSLTPEEVDNYKKINKPVYRVVIDDVAYHFRTKESERAIDYFLRDLSTTVINNFVVVNGLDTLSGREIKNKNQGLYSEYSSEYKSAVYKSFGVDYLVGNYSFKDVKSLQEISAITGYKVMPAYPNSQVGVWKSGGVVLPKQYNGHE